MSHTTQIVYNYIVTTFCYVDESFILYEGTWSAVAQVRNSENILIADLDVTLEVVDAETFEHSIVIEKDAIDTADWPVAKLRCNIVFKDTSSPQARVPTTSFVINSKRSPTEVA